MPRKLSNVLTPLAVKNARPGRHADGGGLHLLVKGTGARSWVYRFMLNGKSHDVGLGAAGQGGISLADARLARDALRLKVKAGIDPLEERQQAAANALAAAQAAAVSGITFKSVAEAYITANEASWRNQKHRQQWRNTLASYVYPVIGEVPVADVRTMHVLQILEPIWQQKPETASRIRGRIETVLDAAKARGFREGENPARWRGHIAQILPPRSRLPGHLVPVVGRLQRGWLRRITGQPYQARVIHSKPIGGRLGLEVGNPHLHAANVEAVMAYVLKGASPEVAAQFGLERLEHGGRVIGKRCGTSQNIGPAAQRSLVGRGG